MYYCTFQGPHLLIYSAIWALTTNCEPGLKAAFFFRDVPLCDQPLTATTITVYMCSVILYVFSEYAWSETMAGASLCFRCLACTSSPQLFLTFSELREHFPAAHSTSLQTEAVLLPSSLEALHCFLCSSSPFLKQEYLREHLRSHNLSTSQVIRMSER